MSFSFFKDKWIPTSKGSFISLEQAFSERHSLGGNPSEKIAVFNLMLGIATAACKLKTEDDWRELTPESFKEKCIKYLEERNCMFTLDNLLQVPQLRLHAEKLQKQLAEANNRCSAKKIKDELTDLTKPQCMLIPMKMQKSNAVFRGNTINIRLTDDQKALALVTGLSFCKGNKGIQRFLGGVKSKTASVGLYQICLHSLYLMKDISTTVRYSLITEDYLRDNPQLGDEVGVPCWDSMPTNDTDPIIDKLSKSFLGRLIPLHRFVCLNTDDTMYFSDGVLYPRDKDEYKLYTQMCAKKKDEYVKVKLSEAPWRQLKASLALDVPLSCQCKLVFDRMEDNEDLSEVTLWLGGSKLSNKVGEYFYSTDDGYMESYLNVDGHTLFGEKSDWKDRYIEMVKTFESIALNLESSIAGYCADSGIPKTPAAALKADAVEAYWTHMSEAVPKLMKYANGKMTADEKQDLIRYGKDKCVRMYEMYCPRTDGLAIVAFGKNFPIKQESKKTKKEKK